MKKLISQMKRRTSYYNSSITYCPRGLAITPSQMSRNAEQGIPIASQCLNPDMFDDGNLDNNMDIDPMFLRGMNINDLYEGAIEGRKRLRDAHKKFYNHSKE